MAPKTTSAPEFIANHSRLCGNRALNQGQAPIARVCLNRFKSDTGSPPGASTQLAQPGGNGRLPNNSATGDELSAIIFVIKEFRGNCPAAIIQSRMKFASERVNPARLSRQSASPARSDHRKIIRKSLRNHIQTIAYGMGLREREVSRPALNSLFHSSDGQTLALERRPK
jgi:hypothetical protein